MPCNLFGLIVPFSLGHNSHSVQELAFGQLSALWGILHALGGPVAFGDVSLFRPLWTVVSSSLELCSGGNCVYLCVIACALATADQCLAK